MAPGMQAISFSPPWSDSDPTEAKVSAAKQYDATAVPAASVTITQAAAQEAPVSAGVSRIKRRHALE